MNTEDYLVVVADCDEALFIRTDSSFRHFEFTDYLNRDTVMAQRSSKIPFEQYWLMPGSAPVDMAFSNAELTLQNSKDFIDVVVLELEAFAQQLDDCSIVLVVPNWMMTRMRRLLPKGLAEQVCCEIEKDMTHCSIATIQERLAEDLWQHQASRTAAMTGGSVSGAAH